MFSDFSITQYIRLRTEQRVKHEDLKGNELRRPEEAEDFISGRWPRLTSASLHLKVPLSRIPQAHFPPSRFERERNKASSESSEAYRRISALHCSMLIVLRLASQLALLYS